jgi:hypothetical protein
MSFLSHYSPGCKLGEDACYYSGYEDPEKETRHHNRDCGGPSFWRGEISGKRLFIVIAYGNKAYREDALSLFAESQRPHQL